MGKYATQQRNELLLLFKNNIHRSFSAKQIFDMLKTHNISISTIYRNLTQLENEGLISRVSEKNQREVFYRYLDAHQCAGIIHLLCSSCGQTLHADKEICQKVISSCKNSLGFIIDTKETTFLGKCRNCN